MDNVLGQVVRGDDFYNREDFIDLLWEKLEKTNILLAAPRRYGKTSAMYQMIDYPREGYTVIHMDLEKITEPINFAIELLDKIQMDKNLVTLLKKGFEKAGGHFRKLISEIGAEAWGVEFKLKLKDKMDKSWKEITDSILSTLQSTDKKILFLLDELAFMIENFQENEVKPSEIRLFLSWFRSLRIDPKGGLNRCKFILASSSSIGQSLSRLNITKVINDFEKISLPELTPKQSEDFIKLLVKKYKLDLSAQTIKKILLIVGGGIPYFIQVLFAEVYKYHKLKHIKITPSLIEQIYEEEILGVNCKLYFQHYYERLRTYEKIQEKVTKNILSELSLTESISKSSLRSLYKKETHKSIDDFNYLMADLENDFYVRYNTKNDSYSFKSPILRDWWKRYYTL